MKRSPICKNYTILVKQKLNISATDLSQRILRLQEVHDLSGLTKKEFAQLIGKSSRILHFWETGKTPISERNASSIVKALEKIGILCSEEWLLFGKGQNPLSNRRNFTENLDHSHDIFEKFNLDFSVSSLISFYKRFYPEFLSCLIEDYRYAPRIIPTTLLIAVEIPQTKFKNDWIHGYLYHLNDKQIIPIDIHKKNVTELWGTPFSQIPYTADPFLIASDQKLYPIINIRPIY